MKSVLPAIYTLIGSKCSGRVYVGAAPDNAAAPFIVYQQVSGQRWKILNGVTGVAQISVQIDVYAGSVYEAAEIAGEIEQSLVGISGEYAISTDSPPETVRIMGLSLDNEFVTIDQTAQPLLHRFGATYAVTFDQE